MTPAERITKLRSLATADECAAYLAGLRVGQLRAIAFGLGVAQSASGAKGKPRTAPALRRAIFEKLREPIAPKERTVGA